MNKNSFIEKIRNKKSAPFLFLGSGFTKHYLNTPDWKELLSKFASQHINAYYTLLGTNDLSVIASEIAKEVNKQFWNLPDDDPYKQGLQDSQDLTFPQVRQDYTSDASFPGALLWRQRMPQNDTCGHRVRKDAYQGQIFFS